MNLLQSFLLYLYIFVLELIYFQYMQLKIENARNSVNFSDSEVYKILISKFLYFLFPIISIELTNRSTFMELVDFFKIQVLNPDLNLEVLFEIIEINLYFLSIVSVILFIFNVLKNAEMIEFYKNNYIILSISTFLTLVFTISMKQYMDYLYFLLSFSSLVALLAVIKIVVNKKTALFFGFFVTLLNLANIFIVWDERPLIDVFIKVNTIMQTYGAFSIMKFYKRFIIGGIDRKFMSDENSDVTEVLSDIITKDKLTGLYNAESLKKHCNTVLNCSLDSCLVMVNIDNFKSINNYYGFEEGDSVLISLGKFLEGIFTDYRVHRFNGDQFSILVVDDVEIAMALCEQMYSKLDEAYNLRKYELSISIGITESHFEKSYYTMIEEAELALAHAKENGKNRICVFHESMIRETQKRMELEKLIKKRIATSDFFLYCQPKMSIKNNCIVGGELLIRMRNDNGSYVHTDQFVKIAEETGLICQIDNIVLHKAFNFVQELQISGHMMPLSVNVSSQEFLKSDFDKKIAFLLKQFDVNKENIILEITETSLIKDLDKGMMVASKIKDLGIKLSLDDFGTGYSSINYLIHLPISEVKIDKGLTLNMLSSKKNETFFKSLVSMLYAIDLHVVIEGVEGVEEYNFLKENGADVYQGYYSYKPMPILEFKELLKDAKSA